MRLLFTLILVMGLLSGLGAQDRKIAKPTFIAKSQVKKTIKVSEMKAVTHDEWLKMIEDGKRKNREDKEYRKDNHVYPSGRDPVIQNFMPEDRGANAPILTFEGAESASYPSDANGSVDSNYYLQTVNATFSVYTKTGTLKAGPIAINTIFTGLPGGTYNDGDPIVLYDDQANRWLITEMSKSGDNDYLMMAVSQSSNPLGSWYAYSFDVDDWPDYPKYGIWRDAYYMGIDKLGNNTQDQEDVFAVQRSRMLLGHEAQMIGFINPDRPDATYSVTAPVDNDGTFAPVNSPGIFININDAQWTGPKDQLWIYEMDVDWNTPSNSTFSRTQTIDVAAFSPAPDPIQPSGSFLDALGSYIMNKPVYRNFSNSDVSDEVMVCCHSVQGSTSNSSGIRWYELVKTDSLWDIRQQGTYAPDVNYRWNPSMTINPNRRIAVGYSVTGSSINPAIRYAAQSPSAHAAANGLLDIAEETVTGVTYLQSGSTRWGDYSNISVDPANDSVFWYTNQYQGSSASTRKTKITKFKFGPFNITPDFYADNTEVGTGQIVKFANASYGNITSYQWSISPGTYSFAGGTNANSKNPWIQFSATGSYDIQLTVSDGSSSPFLNKTNYITVTSCAVSSFPWTEDFENAGSIPDCWTLEYINHYNEDWKFQNGDSLYTTAHGGTYNAFFNTQEAFTRLISPQLDLSTISIPQLDFWYAQDGNTTSYYEFKVLYKGADNAPWTVLKTYKSQTASWTHDTIVLPNNTNNSYIAFESGAESSGYGACIDDVKVEASGVNCAPPIGPGTSPGSTTAVASWLDQYYNPTWELEYGLQYYAQGSGTTVTGITDTSYTITGLSPSTSYDWYARKVCAPGTDTSDWTGPVSFTTTKVPYSLPVSEDFEGGFVKFVNASGNGTDFALDNSIYHGGSKSAYNNYSYPNLNYLVMDSYVDLSSASYPVLSFWHIAKTATNVNCKVQISTDNGTSWVTLPTKVYEGSANNYSSHQLFDENSYSSWAGSPVDNTWWKKETFPLDNYKESKVKIRFFLGANSSVIKEGWYIDDILIEDRACPGIYPDSLFTNNIQATSAKLSWTEKGTATSWDIEYGASGFAQGTGTTIAGATTNPYTLSSLTASTDYDWYVRSGCGGGNYGDWRGPGSFTTTCAATTLPYFEDFEGVTTPALPQCFTKTDANNDANSWGSVSYTAFSGTKSVAIGTTATRAANDWMFTPGITLQSGVSYQIDFVYASLGGHESMELKYGNYPDQASMGTTAIWAENDITSWSWTLATANVTPTATDIYYFGFHATSPLGSSGFSIDDIYINVNSNVATWTGSSSNDWYVEANWAADTLPTVNTVVNISATATNFPTFNKLSLAGTLNLKSSASGNASIMGESYFRTPNKINVEQYLTAGKWHLLSNPVDTSTLSDLYFSHNPEVWIKKYNEPTDDWTYLSSLATGMPVGKGYAVWVEAGTDVTATFNGNINGSDVYLSEFSDPPLVFTSAAHGYNLVGNPFPSALDWDNSGWDTTNIDGSIWVWSQTAGNYLYRNSQGQGSLANGIIPRGQGFFIRTNNTNMFFTIPTSARVHSNQNFYKASLSDYPYAVVQCLNGESKDEAWISFTNEATDDYDNGYDVGKMFSNGDSPELYFKDNNRELSILSWPELYDDSRIAQLFFKAGKNGPQELVLAKTELMDDFDILLEDLKLGKIINFKKEPVYYFDATTYQNPDRFRLHFMQSPNSVDDNISGSGCNIYYYNKSIYVKRDVQDIRSKADISVFDLYGRKLVSTSSYDQLIRVNIPKGSKYYIVRVIEKGNQTLKKVFAP